jgi:hypothetical protein
MNSNFIRVFKIIQKRATFFLTDEDSLSLKTFAGGIGDTDELPDAAQGSHFHTD